MLIGDPEVFASESFVNKVYPSTSFLALGYFSIYISGGVYGVRLPEASMLGCSFNSVQRRIEQRGLHLLPSVSNFEASVISEFVQNAIYSENPYDKVLDMSREDLWNPYKKERFYGHLTVMRHLMMVVIYCKLTREIKLGL